MANQDKLINVFANAFDIDPSKVTDELEYRGIPEWDSVSHMVLISYLEDEFAISIDTDDVIDMSSFAKSMEILEKYGIRFETNVS